MVITLVNDLCEKHNQFSLTAAQFVESDDGASSVDVEDEIMVNGTHADILCRVEEVLHHLTQSWHIQFQPFVHQPLVNVSDPFMS